MPNVHPFFVHFPVALLTISFLADLLGVLTGNQESIRVGWWTLLIGTIGLLATVASGLLAEQTVVITELARSHFEIHQQIAFIVAAVFAALLLWRIASRTYLPNTSKALFLAISFAGVVLMWVGAWYGGELVYRYGIGVVLR